MVDLEARPCPPDPPAPSTLAALVSLGLVRPGPTTAHGHRSQAPPAPTALQPGPPGPPAPSTPAALVSLGLVRPGPTTTHRRRGQAPPPPTGSVGDSGETVIAFAGVCSIFGEIDGTIASQIHPFSALFWRAKASWVSWRRPEVPALVLTVSSRGAVSGMGATKFAQRRLSMAIARKYSPSVGKMAQNGHFMACWASFFAEMAHMTSRWSSFCAHRHRN